MPAVAENCPEWCEADHTELERHRRAIVTIPVIATGTEGASATEFMAELYRELGNSISSIYIGDGQSHQIDVTVESARRIAGVIRSMPPTT